MLDHAGKNMTVAICAASLLCLGISTGCAATSPTSGNANTGTHVSVSSQPVNANDGSDIRSVVEITGNVVYAKSGDSGNRGIGGYDRDDVPIIAHTQDQLIACLGNDYLLYDETGEVIGSSDDIRKMFDDEYFKDHDVICAKHTASSGSIAVSVSDISTVPDGNYSVIFKEESPEGMMTMDMAYWTAIIPVAKS